MNDILIKDTDFDVSSHVVYENAVENIYFHTFAHLNRETQICCVINRYLIPKPLNSCAACKSTSKYTSFNGMSNILAAKS